MQPLQQTPLREIWRCFWTSLDSAQISRRALGVEPRSLRPTNGFVAVDSQTFKPLVIAPKYEVTTQSGLIQTFDMSEPLAQVQEQIRSLWLREANAFMSAGKTNDANEIRQNLTDHVDQILSYLQDQDTKTHQEARFALGATLIPPLVLLVSGLLVTWISRGFARG
jgi:hypothetical protein